MTKMIDKNNNKEDVSCAMGRYKLEWFQPIYGGGGYSHYFNDVKNSNCCQRLL